MLAENWTDKVIEVQCISDRIIHLKLIIDKAVFTFLSVFAPQVGRTGPKKESFYDQLQCAVDKVPATEILVPVGDWNCHAGASASVYSDDHGGHSFGTCNTEDKNPGIRHSKWSPGWQHLVQEERHTPDHIQLWWRLNPDRLHTLPQEFQQCSQQCESHP